MANDASTRLFGSFVERIDPLEIFPDGRRNALRFTFHPKGLRPAIRNWHRVESTMLDRIRGELRVSPGNSELQEPLEQIESFHSGTATVPAPCRETLPVVPLELAKGDYRAKLFSTISTVGTPLDVTLQELRIGCFFTADEETANFAKTLASTVGPDELNPRVATDRE